MEAQRYPYDFDGIIAGAPVHRLQELAASIVWTLQMLFMDNFAGNLAFDTNGDGSFDSLKKVNILKDAVLAKCDATDGVRDGVIDDPLQCDFDPRRDLEGRMCPGDVNAEGCFTTTQLKTIQDIYAGPRDSKGVQVYKGRALGSEFGWPNWDRSPRRELFAPFGAAAFERLHEL